MGDVTTLAKYMAQKKYGLLVRTVGSMIFLAAMFLVIKLAGGSIVNMVDERVCEIVKKENEPIIESLEAIKIQNSTIGKIQFNQILSSGKVGYDKVKKLSGEALYDKLDHSQNGEAIKLALSISEIRDILKTYDTQLTIFLLNYYQIDDSV